MSSQPVFINFSMSSQQVHNEVCYNLLYLDVGVSNDYNTDKSKQYES